MWWTQLVVDVQAVGSGNRRVMLGEVVEEGVDEHVEAFGRRPWRRRAGGDQRKSQYNESVARTGR